MNKLVACALLGFGLTQVLVGCSDDDDEVSGTSGSSTGGSSAGKSTGGSSSAGKSTGGSSSGGKAGSSTGGTGTAGNTTAGSAGKGGSATAGTTSMGGEGGVAGDSGVAGEGGVAGDSSGGMGGAGGEPPVVAEPASEFWLNQFCQAKSSELLQCESSPSWAQCYSTYHGFMYSTGDGICPGEETSDNPVNTIALFDAMDALAAACPDPDVSQWDCTASGAPRALDIDCRNADEARRVATMNCGL